ncbi:phosphoglycerate kinase [Breznakiella homolactica]|uniref:Phosphoglycerate kinase n=1 Tax=Breznakiella homolactica TaxID=2798577 RepID=A0A7T7XMV8_9SPIR|nr:phosphoglycerate kinase [Breznakiella homolactica]QQO09148.1 phosphoglycerate kinase [Breznakiella homolactica]
MEGPVLKIKTLGDFDFRGKTVIFRPDINSPIDGKTQRIVNTNRIEKTIPTLKHLTDSGARVAIIAHQGDTLDYVNLIPMSEHAEKLSALLGRPVAYIDDVCGPAAQAAVKNLTDGEAILLGNLRYLTEEVSGFEKEVKLKPEEMRCTYLIRSLAPLGDIYVNDAFAAAHRNAPSMVAFQELLPAAGGIQFMEEYTALKSVMDNPRRPCVFVLGGAKISDAFGMMRKVLEDNAADTILAGGVTGLLMLLAKGVKVGAKTEAFMADRDLLSFLLEAKDLLAKWGDRYVLPVDLAYEYNGGRAEVDVATLPAEFSDRVLFPDIGHKTIALFKDHITRAGAVFVNGPAGMYEDPRFTDGTREIWQAIAEAPGYTVVGGGDTISAAAAFADLSSYSYICTAGGAMVRFLAGKKLPLIEAMEKAGALNLTSPIRNMR